MRFRLAALSWTAASTLIFLLAEAVPAQYARVPTPKAPATVSPGVGSTAHTWHLGVTGCDTIYGVELSSVVVGSAAAQHGLKPGYRIIEVNGNRVGIVARRVNPLSAELQRSTTGQVQLLIWDAQTQLEKYITVTLAKR